MTEPWDASTPTTPTESETLQLWDWLAKISVSHMAFIWEVRPYNLQGHIFWQKFFHSQSVSLNTHRDTLCRCPLSGLFWFERQWILLTSSNRNAISQKSMLSKTHCLGSKIHCLTNQSKPDNGQWHRVSRCVLRLTLSDRLRQSQTEWKNFSPIFHSKMKLKLHKTYLPRPQKFLTRRVFKWPEISWWVKCGD